MKDNLDHSTQDWIIPQPMYKVNYQYALNNNLRTGSFIFECKDHKEATKLAEDKLKEAGHKWYHIRSITKLT